jgi:hypothetical protein
MWTRRGKVSHELGMNTLPVARFVVAQFASGSDSEAVGKPETVGDSEGKADSDGNRDLEGKGE